MNDKNVPIAVIAEPIRHEKLNSHHRDAATQSKKKALNGFKPKIYALCVHCVNPLLIFK